LPFNLNGVYGEKSFSTASQFLSLFVAGKPVQRLFFLWQPGCFGWRIEFTFIPNGQSVISSNNLFV